MPLAEAGYEDIRDRLGYYLGVDVGSEFKETIRDASGATHALSSFDELHQDATPTAWTEGRQAGQGSRHSGRFIEAHSSIYNGVSSPHLYEAMARIRSEYRLMTLGSFNVGTLLADFD